MEESRGVSSRWFDRFVRARLRFRCISKCEKPIANFDAAESNRCASRQTTTRVRMQRFPPQLFQPRGIQRAGVIILNSRQIASIRARIRLPRKKVLSQLLNDGNDSARHRYILLSSSRARVLFFLGALRPRPSYRRGIRSSQIGSIYKSLTYARRLCTRGATCFSLSLSLFSTRRAEAARLLMPGESSSRLETIYNDCVSRVSSPRHAAI